MVWFQEPLDISQSKAGQRNRLMIGLPADINTIGWSISIPNLPPELFVTLLDASLAGQPSRRDTPDSAEWRIEDSYSLVKTRARLGQFRSTVLERHTFTCVICGTRLRLVLDAAHIRSYASDVDNRANPANGICLCRFCHAVFDASEIMLRSNGTMEVLVDLTDKVTRAHFEGVESGVRQKWLDGVNKAFLDERASAAREAKPTR
jgi:hypothetical protein